MSAESEGGGRRLDRADISQQAEIQHICESGAGEVKPGQEQPLLKSASARWWLYDQGASEQWQEEQWAAEAAERGEAIVRAALLANLAAGEKVGETVTGGGNQAGRGAEQQLRINFDRTGTGQHGDAKQPRCRGAA